MMLCPHSIKLKLKHVFFFNIYITANTIFTKAWPHYSSIVRIMRRKQFKKTNLKQSSNRGMKENKYRGPALSGRLAALAGGDLWRRLSVVQVLVLTTICCSAVLCHCTRVQFHHSLVLQPVLSCIATTRVLLSSFTFVSVRWNSAPTSAMVDGVTQTPFGVLL